MKTMFNNRRKTKILYIITDMKTGGAEVLLRDINRSINKDLFDITILSLTSLGEIGEEIKKAGGKINSLNINFKFNPIIFFKLFSFIKKCQPDVIHTHLFHAHVLGRVVGKIAGVPAIISTFHSDNFGSYIREKLLKYTDSLAKINTAVSKAVSNQLVSKNISSEEKIRVVHNGIDLNRFSFRDQERRRKIRERLNLSEEEKLLISVGRLHKVKGHEYLIESFKRVKEEYPDSKLAIIGEGEEKNNLLNEISQLDLSESVWLLGRKGNVSDYLQAGDLFVSPSVHEGFGISIAEAMACGVPVVATNVGGVSELVEDKETGFLAKPESVADLADRIKHLLGLPADDIKKVTNTARKNVEEKFSIGKMVGEYEDLYKELSV